MFAPLYRQIRHLLVESLRRGEWMPGTAIPSETELALRFQVSQGTVRKAIDELASENLLVRRACRERDLQQRGDGEHGRDAPVALPFVAQPQVHAVTVIPAEPVVIGQPDEAAVQENHPIARPENRPARR